MVVGAEPFDGFRAVRTLSSPRTTSTSTITGRTLLSFERPGSAGLKAGGGVSRMAGLPRAP